MLKLNKRTWTNRLFGMTTIGPDSRWIYPLEVKRGWLPYQEYEYISYYDVLLEQVTKVFHEAFRKFIRAVLKTTISTQQFSEVLRKVPPLVE